MLSDRNGKLIEVYRQVKNNLDEVIDGLDGLRPSKQRYLQLRAEAPTSAAERAIRFLYLNRTAFNGMYRVNRNGEFNVPYGCKPRTVILDRPLLQEASLSLQTATLLQSDFERQLEKASKHDIVYCDPPFTVKHDNNGFIRYNESIFRWEDQIRLAEACHKAARRGARVIVSNARHEPVRKLYIGFNAQIVTRNSMVSGKVEGRGCVAEYLFVSR